jgi:hypothetical protein
MQRSHFLDLADMRFFLQGDALTLGFRKARINIAKTVVTIRAGLSPMLLSSKWLARRWAYPRHE